MRIVSGGQTGVDRAALDVALKHGIDCGGWCPRGRADEFGRIPERYPVTELSDGGFAERTLKNVLDSDGIVILRHGELQGGTEQTLKYCREHNRPHEVIDAATVSTREAAKSLHEFVQREKIRTLNVAGPRQSEWPDGYDYAFTVLEEFLRIQKLNPKARLP